MTEEKFDTRPGRYSFSNYWDNMFIDKFGINVEGVVKALEYESKSNNYIFDEPRKEKYKKKLNKYKDLERSSKVLSKKRIKTKRRKKTKNIMDRAKHYEIDSDEYIDLMSTLPTKDSVEYLY